MELLQTAVFETLAQYWKIVGKGGYLYEKNFTRNFDWNQFTITCTGASRSFIF